MGVRFPSVASTTFVGPLPANATETVVLVTPPLNPSLDFSQVFLLWSANIATGVGTTNLGFRLRRGTTIAGASVNAAINNFTTTAGNTVLASGCYPDAPGAVAGQQYCLTVVQTGATAAGVWADGSLIAFAL